MELAAENGARLNFLTEGITRMTITTSGNVGIGSTTTYTFSRMNVVSPGTGSDTTNWIAANFGGTGTNPRVVIGCLNGAATIGAHSSDLTAWADLCLAPGGNVGIGTATPKAPLHVEPRTTSTPVTNVSLVLYGNSIVVSGGGTSNYNISIYAKGTIASNESMLSGQTYNFSDQRIKRNIRKVDSILDTIHQIDVVSYDHIDLRKSSIQYGVVAQQIKPVIPSAVSSGKNWVPAPYAIAKSHSLQEGLVTLIVDTSSPELQVGRRIRLYIEYNKKETEYETELISLTPISITCKVWDTYHNDDVVVVYGVEVDDFLSVDKQQLGLLALAGVQEVHKMVTVHESTIVSVSYTHLTLPTILSV